MMKKIILNSVLAVVMSGLLVTSCKKQDNIEPAEDQNDELAVRAEAESTVNQRTAEVNEFAREFEKVSGGASAAARRQQSNIVEIASSLPIFKSLVAAVVKTGLAATLSSEALDATVFAPTDAAFAQLPHPFNNARNIAAITDPVQIDALRNVLLYHVLGTEVKRREIARGRSSAVTLKPAGAANDNTIYISNNLGLILINGNSPVLITDVDASNGVIHVIGSVLQSPSQNIATIAIGTPQLSTLVAALVKTDLAGVFAGSGDFTVFAPTNRAFSRLDAPFNNAANINAISDPAQVTALANILKYHVVASRYFGWDLGIFLPIETIAPAPNNRVVGVLGLNGGYVKGNRNNRFSAIHPANVLATNGVVHIIDRVLLP